MGCSATEANRAAEATAATPISSSIWGMAFSWRNWYAGNASHPALPRESIYSDRSGKRCLPIMPHVPRLPLNTLTAFRAVAELENLRAAADTLHLTHSAVSQQIRTLEERLGFALFERRGRRVVLNPAGQALLRSVQGALSLLEDGVQAAAAARGDAQRLRVTVLP